MLASVPGNWFGGALGGKRGPRGISTVVVPNGRLSSD